MIEFWVDPESPYARELFQSGKRFVFFWAMDWRSALATKAVQDMGLAPVCHLEGGFTAWREAGGEIEKREPKPAERVATARGARHRAPPVQNGDSILFSPPGGSAT
jgi:hypothetical protein